MLVHFFTADVYDDLCRFVLLWYIFTYRQFHFCIPVHYHDCEMTR